LLAAASRDASGDGLVWDSRMVSLVQHMLLR